MGGAPCKNSRHDTYLSMRVTLCNEVRWRSFLSLPAPPSFRCSCVPSGAFKVSSPAFGVKHHRLTLESSAQRAAARGSFCVVRHAQKSGNFSSVARSKLELVPCVILETDEKLSALFLSFPKFGHSQQQQRLRWSGVVVGQVGTQ